MTIKDVKIKFNNKIAQNELDIILSFVIKKDKVFVFTHPEKKLTIRQINKVKKYIKQRKSNIPMAYILGHKEFYGLDFFVNKHVLVPRPETELMVEAVMKNRAWNSEQTIYVDIGTGSGCILLTLAKLSEPITMNPSDRPGKQDLRFFGIDYSKKALIVARKNAKYLRLKKEVKFIHGDLLSPLFKHNSKIDIRKSHLVVTANLPYLTPKQIKNSPSIKKEPRMAFVAGKDGLKYYRKLFKQANDLCSMFHVPCSIFCEIDPLQKKSFSSLVKEVLPQAKLEIKKDLKDHWRLGVLTLNL